MSRRRVLVVALATALVLSVSTAWASPSNVRLSNDSAALGGYVSAYTLATGIAYTDPVLQECSISRGRQNEPAVAVDPRNTNVLVGSSNDYCGVYAGSPPGTFVPAGPIWLGYYRSEDAGAGFQSSLVPGYPGDTSPYAALAQIRTAESGDPVIAWDGYGRVFMGSESSADPAGSAKTFGDVWVATYVNPAGPGGATVNDGKQYVGTVRVAKGSSAPNLLGKFNDKTAIEADRTGSACDANVYFAWSRFTGNAGDVSIYFSRSTDHGMTWSRPKNLTPNVHDVQFPDISITGNGNVYVTYRQFAANGQQTDAVSYAKSTNCGRTFSAPQIITTFTPWSQQDIAAPVPVPPASAKDDPLFTEEPAAPGSLARDCGDFWSACVGPYTFARVDTQVRSTADQYDKSHQYVYIVFDSTKPGTEVATGNTYGTVASGTGSQAGVYFIRFDGATGSFTPPALIAPESTGHQIFPDVSADGGMLHAIWWDSRNDPNYSPARPIGNDANGLVGPSLDVYAADSTDAGDTWSAATRLSDVTSNPDFEQFSSRTVPFAGDYLWVTSLGSFAYATWTDWRDTVAGADPREASAEDNDGADVLQCRTFNSVGGFWTGDQCPHDGGIDQNIYGSMSP